MIDERVARVSRASNDVNDTLGQVGLLQDLGENHCAQRCCLRWLDHDSVSCRERRSDLPREHEQREVPRDYLSGNAERLRVRAEACIVELVGPTGVVEEPSSNERYVNVTALLDWLSVVETLGNSKLAGSLLHEARDAEEVFTSVGARQLRPRAIVCFAGCGDCGIHISVVGVGDRRDFLLGCR